jgi:hypothetical protein
MTFGALFRTLYSIGHMVIILELIHCVPPEFLCRIIYGGIRQIQGLTRATLEGCTSATSEPSAG